VAGDYSLEYTSVSTFTPQSNSPSECPFTCTQPIRSGATSSAGRQKKDWESAGKSWMGVVAMGMAKSGSVTGYWQSVDNWLKIESCCNYPMSEELLTALLAKLKEDAGLREKLQEAADLDAALSVAKEAGFDMTEADWLKYQAKQTLDFGDEELEGVSGGRRCPEGCVTVWQSEHIITV